MRVILLHKNIKSTGGVRWRKCTKLEIKISTKSPQKRRYFSNLLCSFSIFNISSQNIHESSQAKPSQVTVMTCNVIGSVTNGTCWLGQINSVSPNSLNHVLWFPGKTGSKLLELRICSLGNGRLLKGGWRILWISGSTYPILNYCIVVF